MTVVLTTYSIIPGILHRFPFDVLTMQGKDSVDFLQRISTNDFSAFAEGMIRKTLLVSDKGRIVDAVWVIHRPEHLLILTSDRSASAVKLFLDKYIIMDDVVVKNTTPHYHIDVQFNHSIPGYHTDFFGFDATFVLSEVNKSDNNSSTGFDIPVERWRIEHGIPKAGKEIVQDYNPLELNLWDWISFTKGCYIGQEVIARLDTYKKIQRSLCHFSSKNAVTENDVLIDQSGADVGRITSVLLTENEYRGLAVIKMKYSSAGQILNAKDHSAEIMINRVFQKELNGRN